MRGNPGNLRRAAAAKSAAAQARAGDGLEQMLRRGDPITFRGLAQTAGVSLDFLYRTGEIRSRVEQLRARQQAAPPPPAQAPGPDQPGSVIRTLTAQLAELNSLTPDNQALERTAPVLPMMPGVPKRRSFDYVRHGTIDLFAALNIATGKVIGKLSAQHRAVDFRDFLDQIDRQTDAGLDVHVICDNLSAHKAPVVQRWLLAHPRFVLHFTRPTPPGSTRSSDGSPNCSGDAWRRGVLLA